ncbi:hypothetical protein QQM79_01155 [Marinobacteraceae bacterium S3BR75-40.1]
MTWIIIALILLFILGSITWIMPSPEERRRMRLRNLALQKGFRVKELKGQLQQQMAKEVGEGRWYIYWCDWPGQMRERAAKLPTLWVVSGQEPPRDHPVVQALGEKGHVKVEPFDVVYSDAQGIGGIWDERGRTEKLETGLARLRQASDRLAPTH